MLTENSPIGLLHLASVEGVITDFFPVGRYHDELYEIKEYVKLCASKAYLNAIMVCNKSPWTDWIWTHPGFQVQVQAQSQAQTEAQVARQQELYDLKGDLYKLIGWKPDIVINIYDKHPDPKWYQRVQALSATDPDITIINLNASDPKFSKNLLETIETLCGKGCSETSETAQSARSWVGDAGWKN